MGLQELTIDDNAWDNPEIWDPTTDALEWVTLGPSATQVGEVVASRRTTSPEETHYRTLDVNGTVHEVKETALIDPGLIAESKEVDGAPTMETLAGLASKWLKEWKHRKLGCATEPNARTWTKNRSFRTAPFPTSLTVGRYVESDWKEEGRYNNYKGVIVAWTELNDRFMYRAVFDDGLFFDFVHCAVDVECPVVCLFGRS